MLSYQMIYEIDTDVDVSPKETRAADPNRSPVKPALKRKSAVLCPALAVLGVLNWVSHVNTLPAGSWG